LALRRRAPASALADELTELIREGRACLVGPIRQEVLSGIRDRGQYERLRDRLREFVDLALATVDFERAAELSNLCRRKGVQGSPTDFLICAAAERHGASIFTTDADFPLYARHVPIVLHVPGRGGGTTADA
jgi:predicted nucleic acid-binding protein